MSSGEQQGELQWTCECESQNECGCIVVDSIRDVPAEVLENCIHDYHLKPNTFFGRDCPISYKSGKELCHPNQRQMHCGDEYQPTFTGYYGKLLLPSKVNNADMNCVDEYVRSGCDQYGNPQYGFNSGCTLGRRGNNCYSNCNQPGRNFPVGDRNPSYTVRPPSQSPPDYLVSPSNKPYRQRAREQASCIDDEGCEERSQQCPCCCCAGPSCDTVNCGLANYLQDFYVCDPTLVFTPTQIDIQNNFVDGRCIDQCERSQLCQAFGGGPFGMIQVPNSITITYNLRLGGTRTALGTQLASNLFVDDRHYYATDVSSSGRFTRNSDFDKDYVDSVLQGKDHIWQAHHGGRYLAEDPHGKGAYPTQQPGIFFGGPECVNYTTCAVGAFDGYPTPQVFLNRIQDEVQNCGNGCCNSCGSRWGYQNNCGCGDYRQSCGGCSPCSNCRNICDNCCDRDDDLNAWNQALAIRFSDRLCKCYNGDPRLCPSTGGSCTTGCPSTCDQEGLRTYLYANVIGPCNAQFAPCNVDIGTRFYSTCELPLDEKAQQFYQLAPGNLWQLPSTITTSYRVYGYCPAPCACPPPKQECRPYCCTCTDGECVCSYSDECCEDCSPNSGTCSDSCNAGGGDSTTGVTKLVIR
eukprot:g2845.t1